MYVMLEDSSGKLLREAWCLPGSDIHYDGKVTYRRTGRKTPDGKPIFKQP